MSVCRRIAKKRMKKRNKELCVLYPWLIPRNVFSGKPNKGYNYDYTYLDWMPTGWRKAFGMMICADIQAELEKYDYVEQYRITDIKEKFGSLRWYDFGAPGNVSSIIDRYAHVSENICYFCGKPDVPITDSGWILPMCEPCYKKFVNCNKQFDEIICKDNDGKPFDKIREEYQVSHCSKEKGDWIETVNIKDIAEKIRRNWKNGENKKQRTRKK